LAANVVSPVTVPPALLRNSPVVATARWPGWTHPEHASSSAWLDTSAFSAWSAMSALVAGPPLLALPA
jgi:hypothetical protein